MMVFIPSLILIYTSDFVVPKSQSVSIKSRMSRFVGPSLLYLSILIENIYSFLFLFLRIKETSLINQKLHQRPDKHVNTSTTSLAFFRK